MNKKYLRPCNFILDNFLHTTDSKAILTSPTLHLDTANLCIEMIVGLCEECQMEIALVKSSNESNKESLETTDGFTTKADSYKFPMWQYIRINKTVSSDIGRLVKLKLIPKLRQKSQRPSWAVRNVRMCPPVDAIRYSVIDNFESIVSNKLCQKLIPYTPNSLLDKKDLVENLHCPEGRVGPYCSISCQQHLNVSVDCKGIKICNATSCKCPPGFMGKNCEAKCPIGQYGYNCKETCGLCSTGNCSFITGHCKSGCDNSIRYHLPPFCKTAVDYPPPPNIEFVNETTVRATLPVPEIYKSIISRYRFAIWKEGQSYPIGNYTKIVNDTSTIVGYTDDLEPGVSYRISCSLYVNDDSTPITGGWKNFTTRCIWAPTFDIEIRNTSFILKNHREETLYPCPNNTQHYDYLLTIKNGLKQIDKGKLPKLPYEFTKLTPDTSYEITIWYELELLFARVIQTSDGVPSQVRNVKKTLLSNKEVALKWDPPLYANGIIRKYEVVLQVQTYFGCENLKIPSLKKDTVSASTTSTNITFSNLTSYARYVGKITAYTFYRGLETQVEFSTNQSDTPSAVYSNLRFQNYTLTWDAPIDCTTISGPIIAKILVIGISKAVSSFETTEQTVKYSLNLEHTLYGGEMYEARIYAIRNYTVKYNGLHYEKLIFITPPKAPPSVKQLEIYEIDWKSKNVHLRWLEPEPPTNGEIRHYIVSICHKNCEVKLKILPTEYCKLWDKYICAIIDQSHQPADFITVSAVNVNVSTPSPLSSVSIMWNEIKPEAPEIIVEALEKGAVNLTWFHPWKANGRIQKFVISAEMTSSDLRMLIERSQKSTLYEYHIVEYQLQYNKKLHLLPSSTYKISIRAVTNTETYGERKVIDVNTSLAMRFERELTMEVSNVDSTILLHIPAVLNDTRYSITNVVVKGSQACQSYVELSPYIRQKADIKPNEIAWYAARFSTDEFANKEFTIGDNKLYGNVTNCPLKPLQSYVIVVIVLPEEGWTNDQILVTKTTSIYIREVPKRYDEAWLIAIIAIFLAIGILEIFRVCRRRRRRSLKKLIVQEKISFVQKTGNLDIESMSLGSKQFSTNTLASNAKHCISRGSTPCSDGDTVHIIDTDQKEEQMSLIKVEDLEDYVKRAIDSGLLDRQFDMLPRGQTSPSEYGMLPQNKSKNRYGNLIAYDANRVILEKLPDDPYSDYINATYIKGCKEKFYIATQGPKPNTVIDFWRMIWQKESYIICMVTNLSEEGKTKCEQYWPDTGKRKTYGDITVLNARQDVFAHFTFRTLYVTYKDEARKIQHLHYTTWPDHDIPLSTHSMITYLKKLLITPPGNGPVVVHCSAGVGRTGIVILCDICLRRAIAEGAVDVFAEMKALRSQRPNMVNNKQQYLFAHLVLVECLLCSSTSLPCDESLPLKIKKVKEQLVTQRESLEKMAWHDKVLRSPVNETLLSERNLAKRRFPELFPAKVNRVYLKRYPPTDENSDYISAVYVDGVRLQNQYIATQLPLPGTFSDFWRMVAEYKVELIVMLQSPDLEDTTCCPIVRNGEFKPVPYINIRTKELDEFEHYILQKLTLVDNSEKPTIEQEITILCSTEWQPGRNQDPPETIALVTLWQAMQKMLKGDGPIAVLCHDGVTGCGLYLALSFLLERMTIEKECDVCLAIRAIETLNPDFIKSSEHIKYLYDAATVYLKYLETNVKRE
ncbi:receptor-type tyrosine-protein phosphatase kappa-like isoform X1 [Bombus impatiens]|uniref:protein-tyrosine-phosphatase n=1 Tax=Bombus impatiens TaxID=132113 RepID=A0A6P8M4G0_BOMIM|nr:receptor-type tyrosine-protein phosphatase kappa-like isoform X1 [Bombus impatiens]